MWDFGYPGDVETVWRPRSERDFLRVLVGMGAAGAPLVVDLKDEHLLVVGHGSELLRRIVFELSITHSPDDVNFVLVDVCGAGTLQSLSGLPGVAAEVPGLAGDLAEMDRLIQVLDDELWRRQHLRSEREPALVVVIDDVLELMSARPQSRTLLRQIISSGGPLGMHLLLTSSEPHSIPSDLIRQHIDIRSGDFTVSKVTDDEVTAFSARLGQYLHPVRRLWKPPDVLSYERLLARDKRRRTKLIPLGVFLNKLRTAYLDFSEHAHFWVEAERRCGKTTTLRTVLRGIMDRYTPAEAAIIMVDYRRTMAGEIDMDHLLGYAVNVEQLAKMVPDVANSLQRRVSDLHGWTGPELFVVIDDYDETIELGPLMKYLAYGADIGFHVILAGTDGVISTPAVRLMRELGCPGIMMSGEDDREGAAIGLPQMILPKPIGEGCLIGDTVGQEHLQVAIVAPLLRSL